MNKNIVKLFAIVMMIFMIGAVLVACGAQGEQGEQGIQGPAGATGEQGPQGVPGLSPYIGENGNWWVGDKDLGVAPKGEDLRDCENHDYWNAEVEEYNKIVVSVHTQDSLGLTVWNCVDCGDTYFEWVDHEYNIVNHTVAPTCTEGGYTVYECACGLVEDAKRDLTDALGHVKGDKEYAKNEAGICACEWTNAWFVSCTACGVQLEAGADGAKGHVWGEYNPMKPETNTNPCTWVGGTVAECENCDCVEHVDVIPGTNPKGHEWGDWTFVSAANGEYTYKRVCADCGASFAEGTETKTIKLEDCGEPAVTAPTCTEDGKKVYTIVLDGQTITVDTVVIPATGHTVSEETAYTVAADFSKITTKCDTCGVELTMELPELALKHAYMIKNGDCDEPKDIYSILLTDKNEKINGAIFVTFEVPAEYGHNNGNLGAGAKEIVIEINGTEYDAYWCETCQHWIAYQVHVA